MIKNHVPILHGWVKSKTQDIYQKISKYVEVGTSINVTTKIAAGSTTCAISSTVTNPIGESHTRLEHTETEIKLPSMDPNSREWLENNLTNDGPGVRKFKRGYEWDWTHVVGY